MIITVTLNPAVDKTVALDKLTPGEVNRVTLVRLDPGGKGLNVSRVIRELGGASIATGFVSGSIGRSIEHSLNEVGIADDFIHTAGQSRTNTAIFEKSTGETTTLNEAGPEISPRHVEELYKKVSGRLVAGDWLVLAGSIPPGVPAEIYAELISAAKKKGALTVLDADGDPLRLGVKAGPFMIKPNRHELSALLGTEPKTVADYLAAARDLQGLGIPVVIISLGSDGAVAVKEQEAWQVVPPKVIALGAVGPGDSMVAGVVLDLSRKRAFADSLRLGAAAAAATVMMPGTQLCRADDVLRLAPDVQIVALPAAAKAAAR